MNIFGDTKTFSPHAEVKCAFWSVDHKEWEDDNPEAHERCGKVVPLLVEALALLLNAGLNPGRDIVTELGQSLVLRSGQAAVVLWRV